MKKLTTITISVLLIFAGMASADAHARLSSSNPTKNQIVRTLPSLVWLEFDGDLLSFGDRQIHKITVTNSRKKRVDIGGPIVGGARISTKLKVGLPSGKYFVSYRVVSEDGHPVEGSYTFSYKPR
jgi:methionine-rich copper-binding protein CopC